MVREVCQNAARMVERSGRGQVPILYSVFFRVKFTDFSY